MLASASQDTYIRLWKIQRHEDKEVSGIKVEEKVFQGHGITWSVKLDAVLAGHEGWVYGVQWNKVLDKGKEILLCCHISVYVNLKLKCFSLIINIFN